MRILSGHNLKIIWGISINSRIIPPEREPENVVKHRLFSMDFNYIDRLFRPGFSDGQFFLIKSQKLNTKNFFFREDNVKFTAPTWS